MTDNKGENPKDSLLLSWSRTDVARKKKLIWLKQGKKVFAIYECFAQANSALPLSEDFSTVSDGW